MGNPHVNPSTISDFARDVFGINALTPDDIGAEVNIEEIPPNYRPFMDLYRMRQGNKVIINSALLDAYQADTDGRNN